VTLAAYESRLPYDLQTAVTVRFCITRLTLAGPGISDGKSAVSKNNPVPIQSYSKDQKMTDKCKVQKGGH
jgi:hypothetical protein